MNDYNQVIASTTKECISDNGVICFNWVENTITTYPMALYVMIAQVAIFLVVIFAMIRRK